jgi:hypothetical protein
MNPTDEKSQHRLFAAIVLMGSGLAAGCGGISEGEGPLSTAGRPSVAGGGTTSESSGASDSVGPATSTGGSQSVGSAPNIALGGAPSAPMPVEPGPFACPPEQWSCTSVSCDEFSGDWELPAGCPCDPKKPRSVADCEPGQVFVCQRATFSSDGRPFTKPVQLSCACVPKATYFCTTECDVAYGMPNLSCDGSLDQLSASCGCAVIYLK